jgi:hypothetical protein
MHCFLAILQNLNIDFSRAALLIKKYGKLSSNKNPYNGFFNPDRSGG